MRAALFTVLLATAALGCATGGSSGSQESSSGSFDRIASEELRQIEADNLNAYQAVRRLRSNWLRARSATFDGGRNYPRVFVDGIEFGELDSLRDINIVDIEEMRFLDAREATTRFGTGYMGGVIAVDTR